ncbi:MAG: hypothetical protein JSR09_02165 [Bacteroidetes bacterium]|nr:hypothetical protein [Bacteroidota bacterium]MBS1648488.1 hypothetical protein [Bacteroidota bacterium]
MKNFLHAYPLKKFASIACGRPKRTWMDLTFENFAYACLPLVIANQTGWDIYCQTNFKAKWNGGNLASDIEIVFEDVNDPFNEQVMAHFGYGVITFNPGFLFVTNEGNNLIVKGIPNMLKDAIQPLEAVVETDWLPFTFTMNWKFTRTDTWINFAKGEPICRIMPYPRNFIESFEPQYQSFKTNPELARKMNEWGASRQEHNNNLSTGTANKATEKNYLQGKLKDGNKVGFHQRKINLKEFENPNV